MDKETIFAIVARNGLDTAESVFLVKAGTLAKAAETEPDAKKKKKMLADAKKLTKLVKALQAAETGLNQYLTETAGL